MAFAYCLYQAPLHPYEERCPRPRDNITNIIKSPKRVCFPHNIYLQTLSIGMRTVSNLTGDLIVALIPRKPPLPYQLSLIRAGPFFP